jgi:exopolyphosphatase/guanosine-5'-triphosphate,3'-diphosphate pyrophosphatase
MALDYHATRNLSPNPTPKETMLCGGLDVEDWPHARQVARLALLLFKATQPLHELDQRAALLLERGALLHNAGMLISAKAHHKHSLALINQTPLPDVSAEERHEIACIARYHRRVLPQKSHPEYARLDKEARKRVSQLAALVRIADALDYGHDGRIEDVSAEIEEETVRFFIIAQHGLHADAEMDRARQKADLFEKTFKYHARFLERRAE